MDDELLEHLQSNPDTNHPTVSEEDGPVDDNAIEDVQGSADSRRLAIKKVGIRAIRHPVRVRERGGSDQPTIATFGMFVDLPHHLKGTHMSRFVELLNGHEQAITVSSFGIMLQEMTRRLEAEHGYIEMGFTYFVRKTAPVSGIPSLMDYEVTFNGEQRGAETNLLVTVQVPVTSLCPCSKKISAYGAHNQRSHVVITVRANEFLWLEDLIDIAESEASSELYGILKRPDEKAVTEHAYENPKFVEDLVRDVASRLNQDQRIRYFLVEAENFESIHNHSAFAQIERDKDAPK